MMKRLLRGFLARCLRSDSGSVAVLFSFALPVLLLVVGGTVDFVAVAKQRNLLQSAADASALAAARGLSLVTASRDHVGSVASEMVRGYLSPGGRSASKYSVSTEVRQNPSEVEVRIVQQAETFFGDVFGLSADGVTVSATATIVGQPHICVLGLDERDGGTITLEKNSRVTGNNCAVYSNSTHGNSIKSKENAKISAAFICSGGGTEGEARNFEPAPTKDCPYLDDPLAQRLPPVVGSCTSDEKLVIESDTTLSPGVYCGGIDIKKNAVVDLSDGVYVIKDGELAVSGDATLVGESVGLYFTGNGAKMVFDRNTTISLKAPSSGPMAGLLIFSDRHMTRETFKILSDNARVLLGTIYLPNGELFVETEKAVADLSAYTAIIASTVKMIGEPNLVLNTDYSQSTVPAPPGFQNEDNPVRLSR